VVLDVMMESDTAGFQLALEVRRRYPGLPTVILSGIHAATGVPWRFSPDEDWLPVVKFIDKPVQPVQLAVEIERILGSDASGHA
jgi:DNA-binding NtrC family response regulator